jgi:hypothetical protein
MREVHEVNLSWKVVSVCWSRCVFVLPNGFQLLWGGRIKLNVRLFFLFFIRCNPRFKLKLDLVRLNKFVIRC